MSAQKTTLLHQLQANGWDVTVLDSDDAETYVLDWWADEAWRLTSVWSPHGLTLFLVLMIDPQADVRKRKHGENIWAVKASSEMPTHWLWQGGEVVLDLGQGWSDRLSSFMDGLSALRNQARITE